MKYVIDEYDNIPYCIDDLITGQLAWAHYEDNGEDCVIAFYHRGKDREEMSQFNHLLDAYNHLQSRGWALQIKRASFVLGYSVIYELIREEDFEYFQTLIKAEQVSK